MKKILTITVIAISASIPHNTYATTLTLQCAFAETSYNCSIDTQNATLDDATCKNICSTCSGRVTLPAGYISTNGTTYISKQPLIGCPERKPDGFVNQYIRKCSCTLNTTIACDTANGYSGTATFDGSYFSGCTKGGGGIIIGPIGQICGIGEYVADSNCEPCPSFNGVAGTTQLMGKNPITSCYIPSGNVFTDDTGTYTLTDDCHYTE